MMDLKSNANLSMKYRAKMKVTRAKTLISFLQQQKLALMRRTETISRRDL